MNLRGLIHTSFRVPWARVALAASAVVFTSPDHPIAWFIHPEREIFTQS
jgi:hypothetical protein